MNFDKERMDLALASPRVTCPPGLFREEKRAFILAHSSELIIRNVMDDEGNMNIYKDKLVYVRRNLDNINYYKFYSLTGNKLGKLQFQDGIVSEKEGANGLTNESVIAVVLDRLRAQNQGKFKSVHNSAAISHLEEALKALYLRVAERESREVDNTHEE